MQTDNNKTKLVHAIWDVHNDNYARKQIKADSAFAEQMLLNIFCPGVSYFYIVDFSTRQFSFVSPVVAEVLGYTVEEFTFDKMLSLVHPDELEHVGNCEGKIIDFLFNQIAPEQIKQYKFTYSLRLKHKDGTFRRIMHQAMVVSQDGFGRMAQVLGIQTEVGHLMPVNNYRLSIIGLNGAPSYLGIDPAADSKDLYRDVSKGYFTPRELEVIRLFADGYTAQKVAEVLQLSIGTVRTHRQNALQKSNCSNMTSLVAKCVREGLV